MRDIPSIPQADTTVSAGRLGAHGWELRDVQRRLPGSSALVLIGALGFALVLGQLVVDSPPRIAIGLFLCMLAGVIIILEPYVGIVGYFIAAFLRPDDVFWGLDAVRFSFLMSASTTVAVLLHLTRRPDLSPLRAPQTVILALFWSFIYLSTSFGEFGSSEWLWVGYYGKLFIIVTLTVHLVRSLRRLYVLAVIIALGVGYLGYWANEKYFVQGWYTVGGPGNTLKDHNDFAMMLTMAIPFMWAVMRGEGPWPLRVASLAALPLTAHAVMLTYSRGGFLGMLGVILYCALRERNRRLGLLLVGGAAAFWFLFAGQNYRDRIVTIGDYETDSSATGRVTSWKTGTRMALSNPWFGVGLKRYTVAYPYYSDSEVGGKVAHNSWVQMVAECGVPALVCYTTLIVLTGVGLIRVRLRARRLPENDRKIVDRLGDAFEGSLVAYLICGFLLSMEDMEFFYILVGMVQILDHLTARRVAALAAPMGPPVTVPPRGGGKFADRAAA